MGGSRQVDRDRTCRSRACSFWRTSRKRKPTTDSIRSPSNNFTIMGNGPEILRKADEEYSEDPHCSTKTNATQLDCDSCPSLTSTGTVIRIICSSLEDGNTLSVSLKFKSELQKALFFFPANISSTFRNNFLRVPSVVLETTTHNDHVYHIMDKIDLMVSYKVPQRPMDHCTKYGGQAILIMEDSAAVVIAARFLYEKHPSISSLYILENQTPKLVKGDPVPLSADSRLVLVGHGKKGSDEIMRLGGYKAEEVAEIITRFEKEGKEIKTTSVVVCEVCVNFFSNISGGQTLRPQSEGPSCYRYIAVHVMQVKPALICEKHKAPVADLPILVFCGKCQSSSTVLARQPDQAEQEDHAQMAELPGAPTAGAPEGQAGTCWCESHLLHWILDYLTNRPQYVRARDCVSDKVVSSTGAPQGTVLAPLLFILYTADFMYSSPNCHLQKFSDDSAIVGLITNKEDSEYRELIQDCVDWSLQNHLQINAGKTKELVVDFRRCRHPPPLVNIRGMDIERVDSYKYLGVHLNNKLDWSVNTTALHKGQSRLYLLRRLVLPSCCSQEDIARFYNERGDVYCARVIGKSRVAPTKVTTVPRLELTAAVVSVKISSMLKEELASLEAEEFFWTDSKVVLRNRVAGAGMGKV
ncbi:hypothetical protein NFI96_002917 [Prochilodus magdalenae]|nr:hypothetical protein NFI96_002917 [Prochilodus magdalenae]